MKQDKFQHIDKIFSISNQYEFENMALLVFNFQYQNNPIYKQYCDYLKIKSNSIQSIEQIPFLPISFFKSHPVYIGNQPENKTFTSSGTTGTVSSRHFVKDILIYEQSFLKAFELFYGDIEDYVVLGLLPSYLEREGSSLIYMVDKLIQLSKHSKSGFYLNEFEDLIQTINTVKSTKKVILFGVSYALLDLAEQFKPDLSGCIIMETGGMKGKRKEMPKSELHNTLKMGLNVDNIHSEYGMTELLSQAYASKNGKFITPPWMKVLSREYNDPFSYTSSKTGGLNVIDLANIYSCSFIATQDLGKVHSAFFEVLGRFDNSDIRGCNLLIQ